MRRSRRAIEDGVVGDLTVDSCTKHFSGIQISILARKITAGHLNKEGFYRPYDRKILLKRWGGVGEHVSLNAAMIPRTQKWSAEQALHWRCGFIEKALGRFLFLGPLHSGAEE